MKTNVFEEQQQKLASLSLKVLQELVEQCKQAEREGRTSPSFSAFYENVYALELVFPFDWPAWEPASTAAQQKGYDYNIHSPLEISMHLTAIFRADRFCEGTLECALEMGTLGRIMEALLLSLSNHAQKA